MLDGGLFDNLPVMLAATGLTARSLFLGHGEQAAERYGPWLVNMPRPADVVTVLDLVQELPAAVFWSCGDDVTLYHHLRRLNAAWLPRWAAMGKPGPEPGLAIDRSWKTVLFRHWDPRVLGALLPVLDETQFSRILGVASEITFVAQDYGGSKRVPVDPDWPLPPPGPLVIRPDQVIALHDRRIKARRNRIGNYLKEVAPSEAATYGDAGLRALVLTSKATGRELNLRSEQAHARWAYLMLRTRGQAPQQPGLREYITDGQVDPDRKIALVLASMTAVESKSQAG